MAESNDQTTSVGELQQQIVEFASVRGWKPNSKNLAVSISIEAAELLEHFQWDDWDERLDKEAVRLEIADVINYCLELAHRNDIDVTQAVRDKLAIQARKYPVEEVAGDRDAYYRAKTEYRQNRKVQ